MYATKHLFQLLNKMESTFIYFFYTKRYFDNLIKCDVHIYLLSYRLRYVHYDKKRGYQGKRSAALYIFKFSFKHETVSIELRVHFASFLYARAVADVLCRNGRICTQIQASS